MPRFTNTSPGARGAYLKGALVMAEPGETIEADDAPEEWFAPAEGERRSPGRPRKADDDKE